MLLFDYNVLLKTYYEILTIYCGWLGWNNLI